MVLGALASLNDDDRDPTFLVVVVNASVFQLQTSSNVNDNAPFNIMVYLAIEVKIVDVY